MRRRIKVVGSHRVRNQTDGDTPTGTYKILNWRTTGPKGEWITKRGKLVQRYPTVSFGPNALLSLEYRGKQGKGRRGMHIHGGRGYYKGGGELMQTHGCMRINDDDIKHMRKLVTAIEKADPKEKAGNLTVTDDLTKPVSYGENRHENPDKVKVFKAHVIDAGGDGYTNMRPNPGSGEPTRVDAGSSIEVLERGDKYSKIKFNGNEGYIPTRYVKKD